MQAIAAPSQSRPVVRLVLDVPAREDEWVLPERLIPESTLHRDAVDLFKLILLAFVARAARNARVAANLACRWDRQHPATGVDPDVALIEPAPPVAGNLSSLRTWEPGHVPPRFAVEVVSESNPWKDYVNAPVKYARLGTAELVIFDPELQGPKGVDGPHVLQVWRLDPQSAAMTRVHAGAGPARSEQLGAWLVVTPERHLRIADDPAGRSLWPTEAEAERRRGVEDLCEAYGIPLDDARRAHIASLGAPELEALRAAIKRDRAWP